VTAAIKCPQWCTRRHRPADSHGVNHLGEHLRVATHRSPSGSVIDAVVVTPTQFIANPNAPSYCRSTGPQVMVSGVSCLFLDLPDAERLANLTEQLGNTELADAIRRVVAILGEGQ
jgi:hypothetical protein